MRTPPRMSVSERGEGGLSIGAAEDANATLHALRQMQAMASSSEDYVNVRTAELVTSAHATLGGRASTTKLCADLAFVQGANATDTVQSTLLVQMIATHDAALKALRMVGEAKYPETAKLYGALAPKLLNAFTRQVEVLAKLQRGGEQVIKHIHIDNRHGGQAVVADTFVKGGHASEIGDQSHAAAAIGAGAAMLGYDPAGNGMPVACGPGEEAMQDARRDEPRRARGE
jgi:hypothetical protein